MPNCPRVIFFRVLNHYSLAKASTKINRHSILPLKGFVYGPLDVDGQKFSVKIGQVVCLPNMTLEVSSTMKNRVSTNKQNIQENFEEINKLGTRLEKIDVQIASNTANIVTNDNDIARNTAAIATNDNEIASNTADIATNDK